MCDCEALDKPLEAICSCKFGRNEANILLNFCVEKLRCPMVGGSVSIPISMITPFLLLITLHVVIYITASFQITLTSILICTFLLVYISRIRHRWSHFLIKFHNGFFITTFIAAFMCNYYSFYSITNDREKLWISNIPILSTMSLFFCIQTVPAVEITINNNNTNEKKDNYNNDNSSPVIFFNSTWLDHDIGSSNILLYMLLLLITSISCILTINNCINVLSLDIESIDYTWISCINYYFQVSFMFFLSLSLPM